MATQNQMLTALHKADPTTLNKRYNPQQLQAAFAALKKPTAQPAGPVATQTPAPSLGDSWTPGPGTPPVAAPPPVTPPPVTPPAPPPADPVAPPLPAAPPPPAQATPTGPDPGGNSGINGGKPSNYVPPPPVQQNKTLSGIDPNESGTTQSAVDAAFGLLTQNVDKQYGRDKEDLEQQLANRGIPYSNDPNSQYQKQMGDLNTRYDAVRANAQNQAVLTGYGQYQNMFNNQQKGNLDSSTIGYQGSQTAGNYSNIDVSQRAQTQSEIESQSRIGLDTRAQDQAERESDSRMQDTLFQQGLDTRQVDAIFEQLKQSGTKSDAEIQDMLFKQGLDERKVDAIFKQLKQDKQIAMKQIAASNRGGSSGGGQAPVSAIDDPFGA